MELIHTFFELVFLFSNLTWITVDSLFTQRITSTKTFFYFFYFYFYIERNEQYVNIKQGYSKLDRTQFDLEQRRIGTWMYSCLFDVVVFVSFCFCLHVCLFVCWGVCLFVCLFVCFDGVVPFCEFQNTAVLVQSKIWIGPILGDDGCFVSLFV